MLAHAHSVEGLTDLKVQPNESPVVMQILQ